MADFAGAIREDMLEWLMGIGSPTAPAAFWISFHTADPAGTGANESAILARTQHAAWDAGSADDGVVENTGTGETAAASSGSETISHFGVWTLVTGGSFIFGGALTASKSITTGDKLSWADAALTATLA